MHELALLRVLATDTNYTEQRQRLRVALPVAEQLDIGDACEVGDLETFVVLLQLLCDDFFELDLTFVRWSAWSAFRLELLKLIVVTCEKVVGDKFMNGGKVWQSFDIVGKHEDECGKTVDLGTGGTTSQRLGLVELVFAVRHAGELCGPSGVWVGWARLFLDRAF